LIPMTIDSLGLEPVDCLQERSLEELLAPRAAVEARYAQMGHTDRHGPLYRKFEHNVTRPLLKLGLQATGLYRIGSRAALRPVIREVSFSFPHLPEPLDGFEILQLSDFHIDGTDGLAEALVPVLSQLRPDVCVFTGDYRFEDFGPCEAVYPRMRTVIGSIRAKHGIFGILGNHDVSEIAYRLEDMGVRMLVNAAVRLEQHGAPLYLLGVDDPFDYRCDDLSRAQEGIPDDAFQVLLAHAPEIYEEAERAGVALYLAGHTHAGQIRVPGIGAIRQNARCPRAYTFGAWRHGAMHGYTSAGVGCSTLPVRLACPPEIVRIRLRRERGNSAGRER
jgi:uncharacterized protein